MRTLSIDIHDPEMERLHNVSSYNKHAYSGSSVAGCFYCEEVWVPSEVPIKEWIDTHERFKYPTLRKDGNATALCPFCGIDSVICSLNAGEITKDMLSTLHQYWFER